MPIPRALPLFILVVALLSLAGAPQAAAQPPSTPDCSTDTKLCIGGRFQIVASWIAPDGRTGSGHAVSLTADSGYFWFFDPMNLEVSVKALDGCSINERFWLFAAGLTNLSVNVDVTDTVTHTSRRYSNPQGTVFEPVSDTGSFSGCSVAGGLTAPVDQPSSVAKTAASLPAPSRIRLKAESVCGTTDAVLCTNGRFEVRATWRTKSGEAGTAHAVQITDQSGYFWFFDPANVEVIVKTLDACAIGSDQWFFAAGMTTALVDIELTDTYTGETRTYESPAGANFMPRIDTNAFSYCPAPGSQAVALSCTHVGVCTASSGGPVELSSCHASPESFQVHVGDSVTWAWGADEQHRITTSDGWDSGEHSGPVLVSHTFSAPGSYSYECQIGFTPEARVYACGDRDCCYPTHWHESGLITVAP